MFAGNWLSAMPKRPSEVKDRQRRIRQVVIAQLRQRQMTFQELHLEVDHFASAAQLKRQLAHLVGRGHITAIGEGPDRIYEHWDLTMVRVRRHRGSVVIKPRARRNATRVG